MQKGIALEAHYTVRIRDVPPTLEPERTFVKGDGPSYETGVVGGSKVWVATRDSENAICSLPY
jgi:hypothetical protein